MLQTTPLSPSGARDGLIRAEKSSFPIWKWTCVKSDVVFALTLISVCGLTAFVGMAAPLGNFAHDTLFLLDNAYRLTHGQVPHRDFSSAWGPVMYLIDATGLMLSGLRPSGIGYANALFGAILSIWVFLLGRTKWSSVSACILGIYTVLLITAPFSLGNNPLDFSYAMIYNRYGYALLGVIIIECAVGAPRIHPAGRQTNNGDYSSGVALGLLAFLKISFAMIAVPLIVISLVGDGAERGRRVGRLSIGFAVVALIIMAYLRFDFAAMFRDLSMAATSRRISIHLMHPIGVVDAVQNLALTIFLVFVIGAKAACAEERIAQLRAALLVLFTIAAGYLLLVSNQQINTFPLNGYTAVALVAAYWPSAPASGVKWQVMTPRFQATLLLSACLLPLCMWNAISVVGSAVERIRPIRPQAELLDSPGRGAYMHFGLLSGPIKTEIMGAEYVQAVNDGMALLRRHSGDRDGVLTFDEFNPFNYLLNRPPPRGGLAAAAYNYIFCDAAHPTAERFFRNAPFVMVRKYQMAANFVERGNVAALMRIYGPALETDFQVIEETPHWVLWGRR